MRQAMTVVAIAVLLLASSHAAVADDAADVLGASGVQGGLVVHLGCSDGKLTAALRKNDSYLVQGLDADAGNVAAAKKHIRAGSLYGPVTVKHWPHAHLPYADGVVNLLVVSANPSGVSQQEMQRVLAPRGVLCVRTGKAWTRTVKPWPAAIDEWTHYLHDASGNAVACDTTVSHPGRLQWDGGPKYCRNHEMDVGIVAAVSSRGRLFSIVDEGLPGIVDPRLPERWALVARDAFSGVLLWNRTIGGWGWKQWKPDMDWTKLKAQRRLIPIHLPRRLVAVGQRVYVTLAYDGPVLAIDAGTGKTIRTYTETRGTDEILCHDGALLVCIRPGNREIGGGTNNAGVVMALDAESGKVLWKTASADMLPLSLTVGGERTYYHTGAELVCMNTTTGTERWRVGDTNAGASRWAVNHTIVAYEDVVLVSTSKKLEARAAADGKLLWTGKGGRGGFGSANPANLYVIDGLVWAPGGKEVQGLDPRTGEVKRSVTLPQLFYTAGHHYRCYRGKATANFILDNKRGTEFMDVHGGNHSKNDWVRGVCRYGILPCNGLLYSVPTPCSCYPSVQLHGFNALAPRRSSQAADRPTGERLVKGPAYSSVAKSKPAADGDWSTFRADVRRSGDATTEVAPSVARTWQVELGGRLTQPVVAGGTVFIASVDAQTVHALDAETGKARWSFTVDGRVDSTPTWHEGRLLFGSHNGWVYCLDAADGRLAWRFRAAPGDRQIVSYNQVESTWPVHGSVLVLNGLVYAAAGRNSYLDGGITLVALDATTGQLRHDARVVHAHQDPAKTRGGAHDMPGAKPDVLVSDGQYIYMQSVAFDTSLKQVDRQSGRGHLFATAGFLDDLGWNRNFWVFGRGWTMTNKKTVEPRKGQLLVHDDALTYGIRYFTDPSAPFSVMFYPAKKGYCLFADRNALSPTADTPAESVQRRRGKKKKASSSKASPAGKWEQWIPVRVRAMVKAGDVLFIAGPPDVLDPEDPLAAFEGRRGAVLQAVSTDDGKPLAEMPLDSPPVFDGMVAANGKLYLTTRNGYVMCMTGKK